MIKRKFKALISFAIAAITLLTSSMMSASAITYYNNIVMMINQHYKPHLNPGQEDRCLFTANANTAYTVETSGSLDTYITVEWGYPEDGDYKQITDDDSGEDRNAAVGFSCDKQRQVTIKVRCYESNAQGNYDIQIRKQRAEIYTFDYGNGDVSTVSFRDVAGSCLRTKPGLYSVRDDCNRTVHNVTSNDESGYTRLNSDIFFFAGHGDPSKAYFNSTALNSEQIEDMSKTKIALWCCCYSANAESGKRSLVEQSRYAGANAAIGWEAPINIDSARTYANAFFRKAKDSGTIREAWEAGILAITNPNDAVRHAILKAENDDVKICDSNPTNTAAVNINSLRAVTQTAISNKDFSNDMKTYQYTAYDFPGIGKRYYKTINGILTNDYYDVLNDGSKIIKSQTTIDQNDINKAINQNLLNSSFKAPQRIIGPGGVEFNYLVNSEETTMYMKLNDDMVPIKTIFTNYKNDQGTEYQDVKCYNLLNGIEINYADICDA